MYHMFSLCFVLKFLCTHKHILDTKKVILIANVEKSLIIFGSLYDLVSHFSTHLVIKVQQWTDCNILNYTYDSFKSDSIWDVGFN